MTQKAPQSAPSAPNEQEAAKEAARDDVIKQMKKILDSYGHSDNDHIIQRDDAVIALKACCRALGFGKARALSLQEMSHSLYEDNQQTLEFYRRVTGDLTATRVTRDTFFTKFHELLRQMPDESAFLTVLEKLGGTSQATGNAGAQTSGGGSTPNSNASNNANAGSAGKEAKFALPKFTGIGPKEKPVDKDLAKARLQTFFRIHGTSGLMAHMMRHVLGGDSAMEKLTGKKVEVKKVDDAAPKADPAVKDEHAKEDKKDDKKEKDKNPEKKADEKKADEKGHGAHPPAKAAH